MRRSRRAATRVVRASARPCARHAGSMRRGGRSDELANTMNQQLVDRIRACPNLPSLPAIALQVLQLAQREDVDISEIARAISKDPALSGKILKTVNSSFYGRAQAVSTISHALVILG